MFSLLNNQLAGYKSDFFAGKNQHLEMRFHPYHGDNILLLRDGTVAHRRSSFANSIAFGEKPLKPCELFLLEITHNENGWSGHLRVGLTSLNPADRPALPSYALPDLNASGLAWIFAITRIRQRVLLDGYYDDENTASNYELVSLPSNNALFASSTLQRRSFLSDDDSDDSTSSSLAADEDAAADVSVEEITKRLDTLNGNIGINDNSSTDIVTSLSRVDDRHVIYDDICQHRSRLPTDVGSRIGVYYRISSDNRSAKMHFVINGIDQGPSAVDIPYNGQAMYPVVDVYGTTKQVQIVQPVHSVNPLQHLSAYCILKYMNTTCIDDLPLPRKMKSYLQYVERYYYFDKILNNSSTSSTGFLSCL